MCVCVCVCVCVCADREKQSIQRIILFIIELFSSFNALIFTLNHHQGVYIYYVVSCELYLNRFFFNKTTK